RFTSMQGCAQPRQGLPFDNPVQAKRSAGYENSKLNRMQYIIFAHRCKIVLQVQITTFGRPDNGRLF
ncbi:MAG: hypothetical protein LBR08_04655, partial [Bacteroidales bacterium]|nr:hypothetical protein [Bacteroidales bacterium]